MANDIKFRSCNFVYKRSYTRITSYIYGDIAMIRGKFISEKKGYIPKIERLFNSYFIIVPFRRKTIRKIVMFDDHIDKHL